MKLLALTALLVIFWSASAGPLNTRKQCEWGASYWCQTYDTALTCGQIEYCQTHVWKNEMKKDDFEKAVLYHGAPLNSGKNLETAPNDDYCSICKIVVKYLQGFVGSKTTEDEVEKEVKLVCNYLGPVATECREFIDHYFDDAWKLLLEELSPDQVRVELRLCNSTKLVKPVQPVFVTETKTSAECEMCDLLAKYIVKEVKEPGSKAKVKSDLEDTCKLFKPVAAECLAFVDAYFDELWNEVVKDASSPKTLCSHLIPSCPPSSFERSKRADDNKLTCFACKEGVKLLGKILNGQTMKDKVNGIVESLCKHYLPQQDQTECKSFAKPIVDKLYSDIIQQVTSDPSKTCYEVGECSKSSYSSNKLLSSTPSLKSVQVKQSDCDVCELVVTYLDKIIDQNSTEEEAEQLVEKFCSYLGSYKSQCDQLVNQNFDTIWKLLEQNLDPKTVCTKLGLCTSSSLSSKSKLTHPKVKKSVKLKQSACDICKFVVTFLDKFLEENTTENEAKDLVEELCTILGSFEQQCKSLIDGYFDTIWEMLVNEINPDTVCDLLRLCNSTTLTTKDKLLLYKIQHFKKSQSPQLKQTDCDICKLVVGYIDTYFKKNSTETEAKDLIEKVCSFLGSDAQQCKSLIDNYFDTIWEMLVDEANPDTVCDLLRLCNSTTLTTKDKLLLYKIQHFKKSQSPQLKQTDCDICKLVVGYIDTYFKKNSTETEAKDLIEKVCTFLGSDAQQCKSLIDNNFDMIWKMFVNEAKPDTVCDLLRLCNSTILTTKDKLLLYKIQHFKKSQSPQLKQADCSICKLVVGYIDNYLKENSTETEAKDLIEKVCTFLGSDAQQCKNLIDNNFDMIWEMLVNEATPDAVCEDLGLCSSTTLATKDKLLLYKTQHFKKSQGTITCILCGLVMKELDKLIDTNSTEADIEKALEKVCSLLPSSISSDCDDFVKEYGPKIIKALINAVSSDAVCHMIGICTLEKVTVSSSGTGCNVCVDVLKGLKVALPMDTKLVTEVLEKLCSLMPSAISDECKDLVDAYGPELVKIIANDIDPQKLCQDVHLCTGQTLKKTKKVYAVVVSSPKTETTCDKCHEVLEQLEIIIPKNEKYFINFLSSLCKTPILGAYGQLCQGFIEQYGHQIIHNIVFYMSPRAICQDFKLCTASRTWLPLAMSKKHY